MFHKNSLSEILPYLVVIPAAVHPLVVGIKYFDLNTFMGQFWDGLNGLI